MGGFQHRLPTGRHPEGDGGPARWYWCGVSGERYGGSTETGFSDDLPEAEAIEAATGKAVVTEGGYPTADVVDDGDEDGMPAGAVATSFPSPVNDSLIEPSLPPAAVEARTQPVTAKPAAGVDEVVVRRAECPGGRRTRRGRRQCESGG